ncbi:MAG: hypothetical protein KF858_06240 [Candidatus Sumerlaeia bacterium]|nr:hypothetical protein [Candidatus Sumerlaeia bacterium]
MARRRKRPSPLPRWIAALVASAVVASWAAQHYTATREREIWEARWQREGNSFFAVQTPETVPASSASLLKAALFFGERPVPPAYSEAQALIGKGLALAPMRSTLWLYGARYHLFEGNSDKARVALERSDLLHPFHPTRRMMAVELWDLLGERDRAIELALQIGAVGGSARKEAASRLAWIGIDPAEAVRMLGADTMPINELADVIEAVRSQRSETMRRVHAEIPEAAFLNRDFRNRMARVFTSPLVLDKSWEIWKREIGALEDVPEADGDPPLLATNLSLERSPLDSRFHLGWQPIPGPAASTAFWLAEGAGRAEAGGQLRLTFTPPLPGQSRAFRWPAYRLPVPAHTAPITVRLWLRAEPAQTSRCRLILRVGDRLTEGPWSNPAELGWQAIRMTIPPAESPELIEIILYREWVGTPPQDGAQLFIDRLEFVSEGQDRP